MELDLTQIVVALIGLMGLVITSVIVPLIKSKLTDAQWKMVETYAIAGVQAAEILIGAGKGEEKLRWVSEYITNQCLAHGIKIDAETVRVAIENAWNQLGFNRNERERRECDTW